MITKKFSYFCRRLMFDERRRDGTLEKGVDGTPFTEYQHLRDVRVSYGCEYLEHSVIVCESHAGESVQLTSSFADVERSFSFGFTV